MIRRAVLLAVALLLAARAGSASAQGIAEAKQWVAEGDKAQDAGDCTTAIEKYRLALGVKEAAPVYLRIGACQETLNHFVDALRSYEAALPLAKGNEELASTIQQRADAIKPRIPHVIIASPATAITGVSVRLNGAVTSALDTELAVDPGPYEIKATAEGMEPFEKTGKIAPGERISVQLEFTPAAARPHVEPPPSTSPKASIPGIVLIVTGGVTLGVSIGFVVAGFALQSKLEGACDEGASGYTNCEKVDGEPAQDVVDRSNLFKGVGWGTLAGGLALGTVGSILLGLSLSSKGDPAPAATAARVVPVPILGPGLAYAGLAGTF